MGLGGKSSAPGEEGTRFWSSETLAWAGKRMFTGLYTHKHIQHVVLRVWKSLGISWLCWKAGEAMDISPGRGSLEKGSEGNNCSRNFLEIPIHFPSWGPFTASFGSFQQHLPVFLQQGALA